MKITFRKVATKELATLAQRVIEASKSGNYTVVENNELLQKVEEQYSIYEQVYMKKTYSGKGELVAEADRKRDVLFSKMKKFLDGYRQIETMPNAQAADELYHTFKDFGLGLYRLNYARETAQLNKLIEELKKVENTEKLEALNLTDFFAQLKNAQTNFEKLYNEQAEDNADLHHIPSATEIRKNLEEALRDYFGLLTAMRNVSGWELIYEEINELVKGITHSKHS